MSAAVQLPFAGCIGCGALICSAKPCGHLPSPWVRLDTYEQLGVCTRCRRIAEAWDAGEISPNQVKLGLEAQKELGQMEAVKLGDCIKVAARMNVRIGWFAMNMRPEKPA